MIKIQTFTFNPFAENTYVLFDETKTCIIIDPGSYEDTEKEQIVDFIETNELKPLKIVNTHCHIDHIFGIAHLCERYNLDLEIHQDDMPVLNSTGSVAQLYGLPNVDIPPTPVGYFDEGEQIEFGNSSLDILFTPGHSPGHVVFYNKEQKFVIGGDVLFYGSIGRTDLPGGDYDTLIASIKNKVLPLGDDFQVHSGHGPVTNIGFEREQNPFLQ